MVLTSQVALGPADFIYENVISKEFDDFTKFNSSTIYYQVLDYVEKNKHKIVNFYKVVENKE